MLPQLYSLLDYANVFYCQILGALLLSWFRYKKVNQIGNVSSHPL